MLSYIYILRAKGQVFDGYRIKAINLESAKGDAMYMFDLENVEWFIEETKQLAIRRNHE